MSFRTLTGKVFGGTRRPVSLWRRYSFQGGDHPNVVHSPLGTVQIPEIPFHELIFRNWSLWEKKVAVKCGATGRQYTFRAVMKNSRILAAVMQKRFNLQKGDFMALVLPNCPEYPIVVLAGSMTGVVTTTVNPLYTAHEIVWQLRDSKAKLIVTQRDVFEKCLEVRQNLNADFPILVVRTSKEEVIPSEGIEVAELFQAYREGDLDPVDINLDDPLILPYSSGTTGAPKGVLLSHRNIVSNLTQISHPETMIMKPTTRFHQDVIFGILPMFHIYGLIIITFYSLKDGCRLITLPRFNPRIYMKNVVKKKVNILYVVPPILKLLSHEAVPGRYLRSVEFIVNAAAPMPVEYAHKILKKAEHVKVAQGYGMTEASPAIAHTSTKRMQKLTSIGIPIASTKIKIVNSDTGDILPKGELGELRAWGPQMMKSYLNRPVETQGAFDEDGWLRTGDVGYFDDDGDFFLVERMKELIKVKGFQVAPSEVEETLRLHPGIADAAVIGIPDQESGELPKAFVVLKEGAKVSPEEIQAFIKERLSSYKHLKGGVVFVDNLPKNPMGKILRKDLKK